MTPRKPAIVALLALVTFGIYGLVWLYKLNKELDQTGGFNLRPGKWVTQITILALLVVTFPVAYIHWCLFARKTAQNLDALARQVDLPQARVGATWILFCFPIVSLAYYVKVQGSANQLWTHIKEQEAARQKAEDEARKAAPKDAPMEQLLQCPSCQKVITVRYVPGKPTVAKCTACGFSAPFRGPAPG